MIIYRWRIKWKGTEQYFTLIKKHQQQNSLHAAQLRNTCMPYKYNVYHFKK